MQNVFKIILETSIYSSIKKSKSTSIVTLLVSLVMVFACFTTACQPEKAEIESKTNLPIETLENINTETNQKKPTEESSINIETDNLASTSKADAIEAIKKLNLSALESIKYVQYEEYFGDKILFYDCNEGSQSASYEILESDLSIFSYENKAIDMTLEIELSNDDLKSVALNYAKSIWGYEKVEITSFEASTLGPDNDFYYCKVYGVISETGRKFSITLNGQGDLRGAGGYPQDVDLSKGVPIDHAREIALELLREQAHIADESNITLVDETLLTEYFPMYVFTYEYRSDKPTIDEYDYNCKVNVVASTGATMGAEVEPIVSNIDCIQLEEAERIAKEFIAERYYFGAIEMADRLTTINSWTTINSSKIEYSFIFEYAPRESSDTDRLHGYSISVYPTGEIDPNFSAWALEN